MQACSAGVSVTDCNCMQASGSSSVLHLDASSLWHDMQAAQGARGVVHMDA